MTISCGTFAERFESLGGGFFDRRAFDDEIVRGVAASDLVAATRSFCLNVRIRMAECHQEIDQLFEVGFHAEMMRLETAVIGANVVPGARLDVGQKVFFVRNMKERQRQTIQSRKDPNVAHAIALRFFRLRIFDLDVGKREGRDGSHLAPYENESPSMAHPIDRFGDHRDRGPLESGLFLDELSDFVMRFGSLRDGCDDAGFELGLSLRWSENRSRRGNGRHGDDDAITRPRSSTNTCPIPSPDRRSSKGHDEDRTLGLRCKRTSRESEKS